MVSKKVPYLPAALENSVTSRFLGVGSTDFTSFLTISNAKASRAYSAMSNNLIAFCAVFSFNLAALALFSSYYIEPSADGVTGNLSGDAFRCACFKESLTSRYEATGRILLRTREDLLF